MRKPILHLLCAAACAAWVVGCGAPSGEAPDIEACPTLARPPVISPDYADCVIPPNIAPLNFVVKEPAARYVVRISAPNGKPIDLADGAGRIVIPVAAWKELLAANRGGKLTFDVRVRGRDGAWTRFQPIVNTVANEDIDAWLIYREMPVYNLAWMNMGVYQRNLSNYDESVILHNRSFQLGCLNCHTFLRNGTDNMVMNVRKGLPGGPPGGMVVVRDGSVRAVVNTRTDFSPIPAIYLSWHPSGKAVAFSTNKVLQCFHTLGYQRDTFDTFSDVAIYLIDSNTVTTTPAISRPDRCETYPTWTPDGRTLYFCSAPQLPVERYREVLYDIMRIRYDMETDTWGKPEVVLAAGKLGLSAALPRISPDGRFLLFCMMAYGNFAAFSPSSDLYMMDLKTGEYGPLDINSSESDAYHSWSSNSRWFVFSSKRLDGLLARPYLSYVDEAGKAHKPVLLPQKDPAFYESCIRIYNLPELVREPVRLTERELARALHSPGLAVQAELDPRVKPQKPVGVDAKDTQYEPGPGG